jgi:hypothetical protein
MPIFFPGWRPEQMNERTTFLKLAERARDALATIQPMIEEVVGTMALLEDPENHTKDKFEEAERHVEKLEALINSGKILKAQEAMKARKQAQGQDYDAAEMTPVIDRGLHDS